MPTLGEVATNKRPCGVFRVKVKGGSLSTLLHRNGVAIAILRDADGLSRLLHDVIALLGLSVEDTL